MIPTGVFPGTNHAAAAFGNSKVRADLVVWGTLLWRVALRQHVNGRQGGASPELERLGSHPGERILGYQSCFSSALFA